MLPLADDNSDRERWPVVTAILIALNAVVFLYETSLSPRELNGFIYRWAVIPAELEPKTLVSAMFLHGGWGHLLGNMLYLWIFGDNVEDRFGRIPFVFFYLAAGVAGSLAQILVDPSSTLPELGASGAISGVLGAYIVMFPTKRVRVLLFFFVVDVPAVVVIGLWAATQFMSGIGTLSARAAQIGGVAYMAHVGGFVLGALAAAVWRGFAGPPRRRLPPPPAWFS
jgi:membrane associated rhomboid family serine protease